MLNSHEISALTPRTQDLLAKSVDVIIANQHESGSFPASPSFPQFQYCWLRDGMYTAQAALLAGYQEEAKKFYRWVNVTLVKHKGKIETLKKKIKGNESLSSEDFLPARFTMDGDIEQEVTQDHPFFFIKWPEIYSLGGMDSGKTWPNFQTDCYGAWLWGLADYVKTTNDLELLEECKQSIELTVEYLQLTWAMPCFDPWEEYGKQRNVATLGCIYGGLDAINNFYSNVNTSNTLTQIKTTLLGARLPDSSFPKYIGTDEVDANSLWLAHPFNVFDKKDPSIIATVKRIESELLVNGGVKRYLKDVYYGGGKWIILTCWLGMYYADTCQYEKAIETLKWVESQADDNKFFPEQSLEDLNFPEFKDEWEAKWWAESPSPLLWSHAMYIMLVEKLKK